MLKIFNTVLALLLVVSWQAVQAKTTYAEKLCQNPDYECLKIKRSVTWDKLFPDPTMRDLVKRINRVNIQPQRGMVIAIPKNLNHVQYMNFSPLPHNIGPQPNKVIVVDLSQLAYGAYDQSGQLVQWGAVSGGQDYCSDINSRCTTPIGTFNISHKKGGGCKSGKYPIEKPGAPMPYCMFFHNGFAIHGSYTVPGYHASHGCVRVTPEDAKWLNEEFIDLPGQGGTTVIIKPYSNATVADASS